MFDIALMNPPYDKNLHLKFLEKVIGVAEKTVSVQPMVYDNITELSNLALNIKSHINDLDIIQKSDAANLFNISTAANLAIYTCSNKEVNSFKQKNESLLPILKKLKSVKSWRSNFTYEEREFQFHCQGDNGYYKGAGLTAKGLLKGNCKARLVFDTKEEKDNFYNSLECWPYKLMYLIDNKSAVPAHLPFMKDYTEPWTDERFYKYFNISKEEKEEIEKFIKDSK